MAETHDDGAQRKLRTNAGGFRFVAGFGLAYLFQTVWQRSNWLGWLWRLSRELNAQQSPYAVAASLAYRWLGALLPIYSTLLVLATIGTGAVFVARTFRRAPAGTKRDPLIGIRDWLRRHPRTRQVLPWAPYVPLILHVPRQVSWDLAHSTAPSHAVAMTAATTNVAMAFAQMLVVMMAGKLALWSLDRLQDREDKAPVPVKGDEIAFRAVAVTGRTQATVLAATAVSLGMLGTVAHAGPSLLFSSTMGVAMAVYMVAIMSLAHWFRQASTIAVGVDGVLVQGTSKTKFYAYRDFDAVKVSGGATMALVRNGKTLVRLQLHGDDVARGEVLAERIRRALELSKSTSSAEMLAAGAAKGSESQLGPASLGAANYRQPSLSREQLWELVEGDGTQGSARAAAAEALAMRLDSDERFRLRIAASHCADPKVRVAIESLAGLDEEDAEAVAGLAAAAPLRL